MTDIFKNDLIVRREKKDTLKITVKKEEVRTAWQGTPTVRTIIDSPAWLKYLALTYKLAYSVLIMQGSAMTPQGIFQQPS